MKLKFELLNSTPMYTIGWFNVLGILNPYFFDNYIELTTSGFLETDFQGIIDEGLSLVIFFDDIELNYYEVVHAYLGKTEFVRKTRSKKFPYRCRFTLIDEVNVSNSTVTNYVKDLDNLRFNWTHISRKKLL